MSDLNSKHNRVVWFDMPVADLARSVAFYSNVLAINVDVQKYGDFEFAILEHDQGNGGCLVPGKQQDNSKSELLIYMNVNGRLENAVAEVEEYGGQIIEPIHDIGPHGKRAIVLDSEGNRIALHSETVAEEAPS